MPTPQRRPGDDDGWDRRADPNTGFLGSQSSSDNAAGVELALHRLLGWFSTRRAARRKAADPGS